MYLIRRPRARWKPADEPLLHRDIEELAGTPEQALQAIRTLTGEIERSIERDPGKQDLLLRTIELSGWILAETDSRRTSVISVEGYKSFLQIILTHLVHKSRILNPADKNWLNTQLDSYSEVFGVSPAQSSGSCVQPARSGPTLFPNASNFIINGGSFISQVESVADGNSAVLHNDIVRVQETSEMILQAVHINIIVLFF